MRVDWSKFGANLTAAGVVFGSVKLAGGPWWAAVGFAWTAYLVCTLADAVVFEIRKGR